MGGGVGQQPQSGRPAGAEGRLRVDSVAASGTAGLPATATGGWG